MKTPLIPPHGGRLQSRLVDDRDRDRAVRGAKTLPGVRMGTKEESDLIMLGMGAFSPLEGFMTRDDYEAVIESMRLKSGLLWPLPVTLSVSSIKAKNIRKGQKIALLGAAKGEPIGAMTVREKYGYDKRREAEIVFGTADPQHPGVDKLARQGDVYLGGPVEVFHEGAYARTFPEFARPSETRAIFADKGWSTIAAFQTRNPIHRSHEHLTKLALEICDGLFIHPVVGKLKPGDIPAGVRMKCYRVLLDLYYPKDRVIFKVYPLEMRYAGPREALLHAIIRQNFGCTHIIIGRDHAGVGRFYGPFDAHRIFDAIQPGDLRIRPIKLDTAFWCYKCEAMASPRTCPHTEKDHLSISGTELRDRLSTGVIPPTEFSRQEVLQILRTYYRNRKGRGR